MGQEQDRVLVCFQSGTGCTAGVARHVAQTLSRRGIAVDVSEMRSAKSIDDYSAVIAGSGIRAGNWHPDAKRWLRRNAVALSAKPLAVFSVGIALAHSEPGKHEEMLGYTKPLLEKVGLEPIDVGVFAGWFQPAKFTAVERWVMGVAKAPEGDFRDWGAIENWALSIAERLADARVSNAVS